MSDTVRDWMRAATARLTPLIGSDASRDARLLLSAATGWSMARLQADHDAELGTDERARADSYLDRRAGHEPTAQIIGHWAFYGRDFRVSRDVLTPRPDTETLVERALAREFTRVLDLGTGSGILAITLLSERSMASGRATDLSPAALDIARKNAETHGVASRLTLSQGHWWSAVPEDEIYDLVVSNPPYVSEADYSGLAPEIRKFEPRLALTPGAEGLAAYREILEEADTYLAPNGWLAVEIGRDQGEAVGDLFRQAGLENVAVHADLNGLPRVVEGAKPAPREARKAPRDVSKSRKSAV